MFTSNTSDSSTTDPSDFDSTDSPTSPSSHTIVEPLRGPMVREQQVKKRTGDHLLDFPDKVLARPLKRVAIASPSDAATQAPHATEVSSKAPEPKSLSKTISPEKRQRFYWMTESDLRAAIKVRLPAHKLHLLIEPLSSFAANDVSDNLPQLVDFTKRIPNITVFTVAWMNLASAMATPDAQGARLFAGWVEYLTTFAELSYSYTWESVCAYHLRMVGPIFVTARGGVPENWIWDPKHFLVLKPQVVEAANAVAVLPKVVQETNTTATEASTSSEPDTDWDNDTRTSKRKHEHKSSRKSTSSKRTSKPGF